MFIICNLFILSMSGKAGPISLFVVHFLDHSHQEPTEQCQAHAPSLWPLCPTPAPSLSVSAVLLCAGRSCVAAISARELAAQGGFAELQRTVNERVRDAQPLDETLWRSLITPRPGLVWAASYSAADAWKRRMSLRLALGGVAALLIVYIVCHQGNAN